MSPMAPASRWPQWMQWAQTTRMSTFMLRNFKNKTLNPSNPVSYSLFPRRRERPDPHQVLRLRTTFGGREGGSQARNTSLAPKKIRQNPFSVNTDWGIYIYIYIYIYICDSWFLIFFQALIFIIDLPGYLAGTFLDLAGLRVFHIPVSGGF